MNAPATQCARRDVDLLSFAAGELGDLDAQRVRAHLSHCEPCKCALETLEVGIAEAREWQPKVAPEHLALLNARLEPYIAPRNPRSRFLRPLALGFAAAGVAVAVGLAGWWSTTAGPAKNPVQLAQGLQNTPPQPDSQPAPQTAEPAPLDTAPEDSVAPSPSSPTQHLRMLTSVAWDGTIEGDANNVSVTMSRGFALFGFRGGADGRAQRRRLRIWTPAALVEVVGTRFFVEVAGPTTHVGVSQGRVRVLTRSGDRILRAGEAVALDNDGTSVKAAKPAAAAFIDDPHLRHDSTTATGGDAGRRKARARQRVRDSGDAGADIFTRLQAAQRLAQTGFVRRAADAYRAIAEDPRRAFRPYRDLCRYEMARLYGFELEDYRTARTLLRRLKRNGQGEVARQSALALCELQLKPSPCEAARCLRALKDEPNADFEVVREADQLLASWELDGAACGTSASEDIRLK